jgi:hypothetical protein
MGAGSAAASSSAAVLAPASGQNTEKSDLPDAENEEPVLATAVWNELAVLYVPVEEIIPEDDLETAELEESDAEEQAISQTDAPANASASTPANTSANAPANASASTPANASANAPANAPASTPANASASTPANAPASTPSPDAVDAETDDDIYAEAQIPPQDSEQKTEAEAEEPETLIPEKAELNPPADAPELF